MAKRGYEPALEDDDPEVWLLLTAQGDQFAWRVCKATAELWSAQTQADELYEALWDWLVETELAWSQNRECDFIVFAAGEGRLIPPASGTHASASTSPSRSSSPVTPAKAWAGALSRTARMNASACSRRSKTM
jgi:hypothetical protein